jgi:SAM-dependent methyltransferase
MNRVTFTRAVRIAGYNWPLYAVAGFGIVAGVVVASWSALPVPLRWLAAIGAALAGWFACASFLAFHWMFDRSELTRGEWIAREFDPAPARWVRINAGLEETSAPLHEVFPSSEGKVLDIYDPASMTEPAITRARQQQGGMAAIRAQFDALPVEDAWGDLVFVMLAAHEIRNRSARETFFKELARIVAPQGKVVIVEHLRDLAAVLAFGPGVFHFFPRAEWLRLGSLAGLEVERERRITPFVRVFIYRRTFR